MNIGGFTIQSKQSEPVQQRVEKKGTSVLTLFNSPAPSNRPVNVVRSRAAPQQENNSNNKYLSTINELNRTIDNLNSQNARLSQENDQLRSQNNGFNSRVVVRPVLRR